MAKIVKVFSTFDESILISMLRSADIEAVSDSTNFQRIQYGSMFSVLSGTIISVNTEDLDEAKIIVKEFIENKKIQKNRIEEDKITNQASLTRFAAPSFQELPELLVE